MTVTFEEIWSGAATIAAVLVFFWQGLEVGRLRHKLGVHAPATTGDPIFERAFRVQMNTLEQLVLMLPLLWLATLFLRWWAPLPAVLGVWIVGRLLYANAYMTDPDTRGLGFRLGLFAVGGSLIASAVGMVRVAIALAA
jgi:glutathione S-transferase